MNLGLHQFLKEGTKDLHQHIEEKTCFRNILTDEFSMGDYRFLLSNLYQFFFHFEQELKKVPDLDRWILNLNQRWKTPSLQKDLKITEDPRPLDLLLKNLTLSQALGIFYVLEGSSLGGHVIQKRLKAKPGWENESFHFYNHYGNELGRHWQDFLQSLKRIETEEFINPEEALQASRQVFEMMIHHFQTAKRS